jgi:hypothetical protein
LAMHEAIRQALRGACMQTLSKKEENAGKKKGGGVDAAAAVGELL